MINDQSKKECGVVDIRTVILLLYLTLNITVLYQTSNKILISKLPVNLFSQTVIGVIDSVRTLRRKAS